MRRPRFPLSVLLWSALAGLPAIAPADARKPALTWGAIITDHDRTRLRDWRTQWIAALAKARANGAGARIAAEGDLLRPDATLPDSTAPDGVYRCRLIKVGAQGKGTQNYLVQDGMRCRIAGGTLLTFDGPQRPNGRLYPLADGRQLFLGALTLGDEENVMPYRRDPDRNILGVFDRIAPQTWRLAMPAPHWQSMLDIVELRPAG